MGDNSGGQPLWVEIMHPNSINEKHIETFTVIRKEMEI
jgi:hypothetical protein